MIGYDSNSISETLFRKQDRIGLRPRQKRPPKVSESSSNDDEERKDFTNEDRGFSCSVEVSHQRRQSKSIESNASSFIQSVVVVPPSNSDGKYFIYPGVHDNISVIKAAARSKYRRSSFLSSLNYDHNISNPYLKLQRFENENSDRAMRKQSLTSKQKRNASSAGSRPSSIENLSGNVHSNKCQCGQYHSHVFKSQRPKMSKLIMSRSNESTPTKKSQEVSQGCENQTIISSIFWKASLNFSEYKYGNGLVEFKSLWPSVSAIKSLLHDGIEDTGLRGAFWELCVLVMVDGPVSVLQALLDMKCISKCQL